jgi:hypothetical protein
VAFQHEFGWCLKLAGGRHKRSHYSRPEILFVAQGMLCNPHSMQAEHLNANELMAPLWVLSGPKRKMTRFGQRIPY